jgi:hypothetical protein
MPYITFTEDWEWNPAFYRGAVTVQFKTGMTVLAVKESSAMAIKKKVARLSTSEEIAVERAKKKAKA